VAEVAGRNGSHEGRHREVPSGQVLRRGHCMVPFNAKYRESARPVALRAG
jgi:hypothetical protein